MIKATSKLSDLCTRFDDEILARSRKAREKANLPPESTQIPNYRQLLLSKKFDKFTRCTCDQPNHNNEEAATSKCKQHLKKRLRNNSSSSTSSSGSSSTSISSRSSSSSSCSSSDSSRSKSSTRSRSASPSSSKAKGKKENSVEKEDEFDDIRSMEIQRKRHHPERLHPDLSFNEPDQVIIQMFINSI